MSFRPDEILFSPTTSCNLRCPHCGIIRTSTRLSSAAAIRFLTRSSGLRRIRVSFTGGEPFLAARFLRKVSRAAARLGFRFGRIMTNGVWWTSVRSLRRELLSLQASGYDGSICVSVDALHRQSVAKLAAFVRSAVDIFGRPDVISIAYVHGTRDAATRAMLRRLASSLNGKLVAPATGAGARIVSNEFFIRLHRVELSTAGMPRPAASPWSGTWFVEDGCRGPGNTFFILPDGNVKPCCGYANDGEVLTIGNIISDGPDSLMRNARSNRFVAAIFGRGLSSIRRSLEKSGVVFPGKTGDHCYFCKYLMRNISREEFSRI